MTHLSAGEKDRRLKKMDEILVKDCGREFIKNSIRSIARLSGAYSVFYGKPAQDKRWKIETLASITNGKLTTNYSFITSGTPFEKLFRIKKIVKGEKLSPDFIGNKKFREWKIKYFDAFPIYDSKKTRIGFCVLLYKSKKKPSEVVEEFLNRHSIRIGTELINYLASKKENLSSRYGNQDFVNLYESLNEMAVIHEESGDILHANRMALKILGYALGEITGKKIFEIHPERNIIEAKTRLSEFLKGTGKITVMPIATRSGELKTAECSSTWIYWKGKKAILTVLKDISIIRHSEEKFSKIFNYNSAMMVLVDLESMTIENINDIMLSTLGFQSREEVIGKGPEILGITSRPEDLLNLKTRILLHGRSTVEEVTAVNLAGNQFHLIRSADLIESSTNKFMLLSYVNITDKTRIENKLKKSEELISNIQRGIGSRTGGEFFSYISQEIKRTLAADTVIIGKISTDRKGMIETLVFNEKGNLLENVYYPYENSPSAKLVQGEPILVSSGITDMYPDDFYLSRDNCDGYAGYPVRNGKGEIIGVFIVLFEKPIRNLDLTEKLIDIFSGRIGAEMEQLIAHSALKESEARFRTYIESSPVGIGISNSDAFIEYANPAMCRMLGYTEREMVGLPISRISVIKDGKSKSNFIERLLAEGRVLNEENTFISKSGKKIITSYDAVMIPGKKFLTFIRDISEQKRNVEELNKLRLAVEQSSSSIFVTDTEGRIEYANKGFEETTGYTMKEVLGKTPAIFRTGQQNGEFFKNLWNTIKNGGNWTGEFLNRKKNGEMFWEKATIAPVKNDNGEIIKFIAVKDDITLEKHSLEELEVIVENIPLNLFLIDRNYTVKNMNQYRGGTNEFSISDVLGLRKGEKLKCIEPVGEHFPCCFNDADSGQCEIRQCIINAIEKGKFCKEKEIKMAVNINGKAEDRYLLVTTLEIHPHEEQAMVIISDITERKKASLALETSEKRYRLLSEAAFEGIGMMKGDKILDINRQLADMYGYTREEFMNMDFEKLIHPEDLERVMDIHRKKLTEAYEHRGICKDGSILYLEVRSDNITHDNEEVRLTVIRDITDKKEAEVALKESEEKFRLAFKTSPDAITLHRFEDMEYLEVNDGFLKMSGFNEEEIIGKNPFDSGIVNDQQQARSLLNKLKKEGELLDIEIRFAQKNGELLDTIYSARTFTMNEELYVLDITRDITEIKKANKALKESEERYRVLVDAIPDSIIVQNLKGDVLYTNPSLEKNEGIRREEIGLSMIHPEDRELVSSAITNLLKSDRQMTDIIENRTIRDGKLYWRSGIICKIIYQGEPALLTISRNISEQKNAEERIRDSEEKYRTLSNLTVEGVLLHKLGQSIEMNQAFGDMFGYSFEELRQSNIRDLIVAPEHREIAKNQYWEGDMKPYEVTGLRKDGSTFPLEIRGRFFEYKGEKLRVIVTRDLTEQKAAEQKIKDSEESYRRLVEMLHEGIMQVDRRGIIQFVNPRMASMLNYSINKMIGQPLFNFIDKSSAEIIKEKLEKRENHQSETYELNLITHDNRKVIVSIASTAIFDENGNFSGSLGAVADITERKIAENQLQENQLFIQRITEQSPDIIYIYDAHTDKNIYINKNIGEMLGYSKGETPQDSLELIYELMHPDDKKQINNYKQKIKFWDSQYVEEFEFRLKDKYGRWIWFAGREKEFQREKDEIVSVIGVITNITLQKNAESALKLSEEKFRQAFKTSPDAIALHKLPGFEFIEVNEGLVKMIGYSEEELIGNTAANLGISLNPEGAPRLLEEILKNSEVNNYERQWRKKDGKIIDSIMSARLLSVNEEQLLLTINRDVTELKAADRALKESGEKFSKAFDLSPDLLCLIDEESLEITEINKSIMDILGYTKEEVIGLKIEDLGVATNTDNLFSFVDRYRKNSGILKEEVTLLAKNGSPKICELSTTRLFINDKYYIMVILRNITERKESEKILAKNHSELIELNKKIAEYKMMALRSAMNPHFIFNSLNSIQYYIGKNEKRLAITYLSLFSKLIRNILNSSVSIRNTLEKELETLTYYVQMERLRFEDKFDFEIEVDENIEQDSIQIPSLIFQPFVENAILHGLTPKSTRGNLQIQVKDREDGILCVIEDNGIGREQARLQKEAQKKSHTSLGVSLTRERLEIVNKTDNISVNYSDLKDNAGNAAGTKVEIFINC